MKIFRKSIHRLWLLGITALFFTGCSSMQPMSSYARTGDTVTIALGGTEESNALVEILKKEDIVITITDSNSSSYPVTFRHLFRIYPDHSSTYVFNTKIPPGGNNYDAYIPPLLGQWMATVDLVDPTTQSLPPLAEGSATISVSSPAQMDSSFLYTTLGAQWSWTNGNLASMAIDILPGTGTPNTLNYLGPVSHDPMKDLEPLPQIVISPSAPPAGNIAGGSFKFVYNNDDFIGGLMAVPANHDPNVQLTSNVTDLGNGTSEMEVMLLNPKGFMNNNNRASTIAIGEMSPLRSARFTLVFKGAAIANSDTTWQNSIQLVSGGYIDLQGNSVAGITADMKKVR